MLVRIILIINRVTESIQALSRLLLPLRGPRRWQTLSTSAQYDVFINSVLRIIIICISIHSSS